MNIDLEGRDPALYAEFAWLSSVTGLPKDELVLLAIKEGFPIARARYNWDAWSDTPSNRLKQLKIERRALKAAIKRAMKAGMFDLDI